MPVAYVGAATAVGELALNASNSGGSGGGGGSSGGYYNGSSPPSTYLPTGQASADQLYQQLYGDSGNYATQAQGYVNSMGINNPLYGLSETGAANAYSYGTNTLAPQLTGYATNLGNYGNSVLNTAFDPQNALYNRTQQQTTDQSNAINAMYGLSSSPYGAGVANQNNTNFNIDWQNQQLARQATGIQAGGQAYAGAANLGNAGMGVYQTAGSAPYQNLQGIYGDTLNAETTGQGLDSNTLNALAAYLKLGQSATSVGQAGSAQNFSENQALGAGLGSSLSSLSGLFGGSNNANSGGASLSTLGSNLFGSGTGGYDTSGGGLFGYGNTNMTYSQLLDE